MLAMATIGAVLGLRFKVFVLVPAITLASVASWGIGIAHGRSFWSILLVTAFVMIALQVGYFAGTTLRLGVAKMRGRRHLLTTIAVAERR